MVIYGNKYILPHISISFKSPCVEKTAKDLKRKLAGETTQIVGSTERNEVELNKPVESAPVENTPVEETPIETPSVETEVVDGETSGGMVETPVDGEGSMTSENVSDSVSDSTGSAGSVSEFS